MAHLHIGGSFTDKDNACKFCGNFFLWGTCIGYCTQNDDDMHCNDTCTKFKKDISTFDKNNEFVSENAKITYYGSVLDEVKFTF